MQSSHKNAESFFFDFLKTCFFGFVTFSNSCIQMPFKFLPSIFNSLRCLMLLRKTNSTIQFQSHGKNRPVSSVLKSNAFGWKVWGSIPAPVKSDTMLPTARHRCYVSSELCCPAPSREDGSHHPLHAST